MEKWIFRIFLSKNRFPSSNAHKRKFNGSGARNHVVKIGFKFITFPSLRLLSVILFAPCYLCCSRFHYITQKFQRKKAEWNSVSRQLSDSFQLDSAPPAPQIPKSTLQIAYIEQNGRDYFMNLSFEVKFTIETDGQTS